MEFNWEEFEEGQRIQTGTRIHVSLNSKGRFFFNAHAVEALGDPDGVSLLYDRRRSTIGVKPSPLNRQSSFTLLNRASLNSRGREVSAKNFCRHHLILPDETLAFTAPEIRDGILILDLNEVRSVKKA